MGGLCCVLYGGGVCMYVVYWVMCDVCVLCGVLCLVWCA